jgi:hypothetical protein
MDSKPAASQRFTRLTEPIGPKPESELEEGSGEVKRYLELADQALNDDERERTPGRRHSTQTEHARRSSA